MESAAGIDAREILGERLFRALQYFLMSATQQ